MRTPRSRHFTIPPWAYTVFQEAVFRHPLIPDAAGAMWSVVRCSWADNNGAVTASARILEMIPLAFHEEEVQVKFEEWVE